jgi:hypothetical protein
MFGFGGVKEEELGRLRSACKAYISAYNACTAVNSGKPIACANIEIGVLACLAGKICPKERNHYDSCCKAAHSSATVEGRLRVYDDQASCDKQIRDMRQCLNRRGVWPKVTQKGSNSR